MKLTAKKIDDDVLRHRGLIAICAAFQLHDAECFARSCDSGTSLESGIFEEGVLRELWHLAISGALPLSSSSNSLTTVGSLCPA